MLCSVHDYGLDHKLVDHPIASQLDSKEKENVFEMTMSMVQPEDTLASLK